MRNILWGAGYVPITCRSVCKCASHTHDVGMTGKMSARSLNQRYFLSQKDRIPEDRYRKFLSVGRMVWVGIDKCEGLYISICKKPIRNVQTPGGYSKQTFLSMSFRFGKFT